MSVQLKAKISDLQKVKALVDIILAYDTSGSISDENFHVEIQSGIQLSKTYGPHVAIGSLQFASTAVREFGISLDRSEVIRKQSEMKRKYGGTRTDLALKEAMQMFQLGSRQGATKILFLFTDGHPDDQNKAVAEAKALIATGVSLIGVGVGSGASKDKLAQLCGNDSTYILKDWFDLLQAVPTDAMVNSGCVPGSEIFISSHQVTVPIRFADQLQLRIRLRNTGDVSIQPNSKFEITGGEFYEKSIHKISKEVESGDEYKFEVVMEPTGNASIATLPEHLDVVLLAPNKMKYALNVSALVVEMKNMTGDFLRWRPANNKEKVNVLLFGWTGAGKSSLMNALFGVFTETVKDLAAVIQSAMHVTTEIAKQDILSVIDNGGEPAFFSIWDTFGLNYNTYKNAEFDAILAGALPEKFKLNDDRDIAQLYIENLPTRKEREIHSIIFVLPASAREDTRILETTSEFVRKAAYKGMNPLLVITFADELSATADRSKVIETFYQGTGIPTSRIFLLDNKPKSSEENSKSLSKDKLLWRILNCALTQTDNFIKSKKL